MLLMRIDEAYRCQELQFGFFRSLTAHDTRYSTYFMWAQFRSEDLTSRDSRVFSISFAVGPRKRRRRRRWRRSSSTTIAAHPIGKLIRWLNACERAKLRMALAFIMTLNQLWIRVEDKRAWNVLTERALKWCESTQLSAAEPHTCGRCGWKMATGSRSTDAAKYKIAIYMMAIKNQNDTTSQQRTLVSLESNTFRIISIKIMCGMWATLHDRGDTDYTEHGKRFAIHILISSNGNGHFMDGA